MRFLFHIGLAAVFVVMLFAMGTQSDDSTGDGPRGRGRRDRGARRRGPRRNHRRGLASATQAPTVEEGAYDLPEGIVLPDEPTVEWTLQDILPQGQPDRHQGNRNNSTVFRVNVDVGESSSRNDTDANSTSSAGQSEGDAWPEEPSPTMSHDTWVLRERQKQARLFMIQTVILERLGLKRMLNISAPNTDQSQNISTSADDVENMMMMLNNLDNEGKEDYLARRLQSYLPSCELPRRSDNYTWYDENYFRIYFQPTFPPASEFSSGYDDSVIKLESTVLKLYKKSTAEPEIRSEIYEEEDGEEVIGQSYVRGQGRTEVIDQMLEEEDDANKIKINVYRYKKALKRRNRAPKVLVANMTVLRSFEGWINLDITPAVKHWRKYHRKNFGLLIDVEDMNGNRENARDMFHTYNCSLSDTGSIALLNSNNTTPHLDIMTVELAPTQTPSSRERNRTDRHKRDASHRKGCVREKLYVSFSDLGWNDWIVQPQGFEAGYCRGTCSTMAGARRGKGRYFNRNLFAQCCGPSRLKNLNVLHYDERGKLAISVLENYVIAECGCRQ